MLNKIVTALRERFTKPESEADDYGLKRDVEIDVVKRMRAFMGWGVQSPIVLDPKQMYVLNPREDLAQEQAAYDPLDFIDPNDPGVQEVALYLTGKTPFAVSGGGHA